eukprot:Pgem_evm1s11757
MTLLLQEACKSMEWEIGELWINNNENEYEHFNYKKENKETEAEYYLDDLFAADEYKLSFPDLKLNEEKEANKHEISSHVVSAVSNSL